MRIKYLFLFFLIVVNSTSFAQWNNDPLVNTPVCTASGSATDYLNMVSDSAGGMIIAWMDGRNNRLMIYAQHLDSNGVALWPTNGIAISDVANGQWIPKLVSDDNGGAIIVFIEDPNNMANGNVYAQHVSSSGTLLWGSTGLLICNAVNQQLAINITGDKNGGAYITWMDKRNGANYDIYAQHVTAAGAVSWAANGILVTSSPGNHGYPEILATTNEGVFIVWNEERISSIFNYTLCAQYIKRNGIISLATNGITVSPVSVFTGGAKLVPDATGGCIISWSDKRSGSLETYVQRIDSAGHFLWANTGQRIFDQPRSQSIANLVATADGGAIIAVLIPTLDNATDIIGQRLDSNGSLIWGGNGIVINEEPNYQSSVRLMTDDYDGVYVAWEDGRTGFAEVNYDIYAQHVDRNGALLWPVKGLLVCNAPDFQGNPSYRMVPNSCGPIVAWGDQRTPNEYFVYCSRIINELPQSIAITASSGNICPRTNVQFSSALANIDVIPQYQWIKNRLPVGTNSSTYSDANLSDHDSISCMITVPNICRAVNNIVSDTIVISLQSQPSVNVMLAATASSICAGATAGFTATAFGSPGPLTYQWKINNTNAGTNSNTFSTTALMDNDSVYCIVTTAPSSCGVAVDTSIVIHMNVQQPSTLAVTIATPVTSICSGAVVNFTAVAQNNMQALNYQWVLNGNIFGTNSDTFSTNLFNNTDSVFCIGSMNTSVCGMVTDTSNIIKIPVQDPVSATVTIAASNTTVCRGDAVIFTASVVDNTLPLTYQWLLNGTVVGTNSNTFSTNLLNNTDGIFCIGSAAAVGCTINTDTSDVIKITVQQPAPTIVTIATATTNICRGTMVDFTAVAQNNTQVLSYQWFVNGTVAGNNSNTFNIASLNDNDHIYCIGSATAFGCSNNMDTSNVITMNVHERPAITVYPIDTLITNGTSTQLIAVTTGTVSTFQWTPANAMSNPLSLSPQTVPLFAATNYILKAQSIPGCSTEKTVRIRVTPGFPLLMPLAFTPDANGVNDFFKVPQTGSVVLIELLVYDRWGNCVFKTSDINKGWDGTYKSEPMAAGTYVYILKATDNNEPVFLKGSFLLMR